MQQGLVEQTLDVQLVAELFPSNALKSSSSVGIGLFSTVNGLVPCVVDSAARSGQREATVRGGTGDRRHRSLPVTSSQVLAQRLMT